MLNLKLKLESRQPTNVIHPHSACSWVTLKTLPSLSKPIVLLILAAQPKGSKCGTQAKVTFSSLEGTLTGFPMATSCKRCPGPQLSLSSLPPVCTEQLHESDQKPVQMTSPNICSLSAECWSFLNVCLNSDSLMCRRETTAHSVFWGPSC